MQQRERLTALSAKGIVLLLVLGIFQVLAFAAGDSSVPGRAEKLRIVDLEGTSYQMGKVHGQTLKNEIRDLIERWKADLEKTYRVTAEVLIQDLLKKTDFQPAIARWTPGRPDEEPFQVLAFSPRFVR